ncbi:hypothetical protein FJY84_02700 [Candidatus Bathyarchaeota archaeon]|nr:hypothetical protein [Candidatus Bathyarchaeota archaeon]
MLNIEPIKLTSIVRKSLNKKNIDIKNYDVNSVYGGAGTGTAIYRIKGAAKESNDKIDWSLILKIIKQTSGNTEPSQWNYYKREVDFYQSNLPNELQAGLKAPSCYDVTQHSDGECWIWMEDVSEVSESRWPLEQYKYVARQLGQFNGRYLKQKLPDYPWLSRNWVRNYVTFNSTKIDEFKTYLDHPYVKLYFTDELLQKMFKLWDERESFFRTLEDLPQTLCHLDAFRRNIFTRQISGGNCFETVLIDWAFVGYAPIGAEILPLVRGSTTFSEVDLGDFRKLDELVFSGYLTGLRDVGWDGDPRIVRLGYCANNIRYSFLLNLVVNLITNESMHVRMRQIFGCSVEEFLGYWGKCRRVFSVLDDEARRLMVELGYL